MKSAVVPEIEPLDDAQLVGLGLNGNREAFGQLVTRYQSPLCALAYSACGDISHSEDLAQEAFIIAWRKLRDLKEPAKFKSWLYGIARNLINNAVRQQTRNPLAAAAPLDEGLSADPTHSNPIEQTITKEEEGILWHVLEQIPDAYREPLILFYREQQSIERVAEALDLSEEAARQRLSRGRKLLHQRVIAFVGGALAQTAPSQAFATSVLAALPNLTIGASSSAIGGAALKGSLTGKGVASVSVLATLLYPLTVISAVVGGTWLAVELSESRRERRYARNAWALMWAGLFLYFLGARIAFQSVAKSFWHAHPQLLTLAQLGVWLGYCAFLLPFVLWMNRVRNRIRRETNSRSYEYRSPWRFLRLPLLHIRFNCIENGKALPARGWVAFGDRAYGIVFAYGEFAAACISMGGFSVGCLALGGFGIGLLALAGMSVGIGAIGGGAIGYMAFGGFSIGWLGAVGGGPALAHDFALGRTAIAKHANDHAAQIFMHSSGFFHHAGTLLGIYMVFIWLPLIIRAYINRRLFSDMS